MAKVIHLTIMLELVNDAAEPEDWDCWPSILNLMPQVEGFSIINSVVRPYTCMEDDPVSHTQH